jgi:hypothetical protein
VSGKRFGILGHVDSEHQPNIKLSRTCRPEELSGDEPMSGEIYHLDEILPAAIQCKFSARLSEIQICWHNCHKQSLRDNGLPRSAALIPL